LQTYGNHPINCQQSGGQEIWGIKGWDLPPVFYKMSAFVMSVSLQGLSHSAANFPETSFFVNVSWFSFNPW